MKTIRRAKNSPTKRSHRTKQDSPTDTSHSLSSLPPKEQSCPWPNSHPKETSCPKMNSYPQDTSSCHTVTGYLELNNHPMVMTDLHADIMYDLETDRRKKYEEIHHSTLPPYPFFDGCSSFMKWLETYDSYGTACGWNHAQRASALRLFLKGRA